MEIKEPARPKGPRQIWTTILDHPLTASETRRIDLPGNFVPQKNTSLTFLISDENWKPRSDWARVIGHGCRLLGTVSHLNETADMLRFRFEWQPIRMKLRNKEPDAMKEARRFQRIQRIRLVELERETKFLEEELARVKTNPDAEPLQPPRKTRRTLELIKPVIDTSCLVAWARNQAQL